MMSGVMNSIPSASPILSPKIAVVGDVVIDFMQVSLPPFSITGEARGQHWQTYHNTDLIHRCGGVLLIADLLKSDLEGRASDQIVVSYNQKKIHGRWTVNGKHPEELIRSFATI